MKISLKNNNKSQLHQKVSAGNAAPLVKLAVQDVVLQSPRQRQEAHKHWRAKTKAAEATSDPQTTQMLQTARVLCEEEVKEEETER